MKEYTIYGVTGYGNSGASAVIDLLCGSDELQVDRKREWQILHSVDGIMDLKHYIVECRDKIASNTAIIRFEKSLKDYRYWAINKNCRAIYVDESKKYIDRLKCCVWNGYSHMDAGDVIGINGNKWINRAMEILLYIGVKAKINPILPPSRKRYFSIMEEEEFNAITTDYINTLFKRIGYTTEKPVVLEQLFVFSNPKQGHEYFNHAKTILVERDPRDVYASSKSSHRVDRRLSNLCRFMPTDTVEKFVEYYNRLHIGVYDEENVLVVHFEDLIYDYENTTDIIANFLGLNSKSGFDKYFHPEISKKNTMFYKKMSKLSNDIKYIEEKLPMYLNHFVD